MSYKPYQKYKPSKVEWIGDIPEHWATEKMRYIGNFTSSGIDKKINEDEPLVKIINYTDVYGNESRTLGSSRNYMEVSCSEEKRIEHRVRKGDLIFTPSSETIEDIGLSALVDEDLGNTAFSYHVLRFRFEKEVNHSFKKYLCNNYLVLSYFSANARGTTRQTLSRDNFNSAIVILPPKDEQTIIANFLDEKTAKIDSLIEKKKQLIELLKEERTAIINQAVTKGINPDVNLKSSGIDWLGDIPEHWQVKKLKYFGLIKYGLGQPPRQLDTGLPLIRATNVERGKINEKDLIYVDPDDVPYERDPVLKENDIIVVRSGAYTADSAIIPKRYEGAISGYDMVLRVNNNNPIFISNCLLSNYVLINQLFLQRLRAAQPHLNKEELGETFFLLPPSDEQDKIVNHIQNETNRIESTISKIEKEIELLQEYRTALIIEIVTGKIKVV